MAKSVILIGAGGHAKVIADIIRAAGDTVAGYYDDRVPKGTKIQSAEVLGAIDDISDKSRDAEYILAIGSNLIRKKMAERFAHLPFYTAIHPSACIGSGVCIGEGCCVMPLAVLSAEAKVGRHCILNTHSVLEHESCLDDFVHLAPGSVLCGNVSVGSGCMIGAGAVVKNNVAIAQDSVIGAGAVVTKDIVEAGVYAGVPVRRIK